MRVWTFLLSCLLAVTRAENVAMTSSGTAVFTSEGRLLSAILEINPSARITSIATGGDVLAYVTSEGPITFVDLPDPLPESDHTNDDANAADDENVTGFPPVDDLTDGARARRAAFAAAVCAVAIVI